MNALLYAQIDSAVVAKIVSLGLTTIGSVQSQLYPDIEALDDEDLPAVCVCEDMAGERRDQFDSKAMQAWYPVRVFILDKIGADDSPHDKKGTYLGIRKTLMDAFETKANGTFTLAGVPEVKKCSIAAAMVFDPRIEKYHHVQQSFELRFWAVEARPA